MEEFAKIVEAYRWTRDCYMKHGSTETDGYGGGSPSSSFASACSSGDAGAAGSGLLDGNLWPPMEQCVSGPSSTPSETKGSQTKHRNDDDGGMLERAKARYQSLSFSPGWYRPGLKPLSKQKPKRTSSTQASSQASPHTLTSTRQLVFSIKEDTGVEEGSEKANKKKMKETKKKKKKSGTKQSSRRLSSKEREKEVLNMPDYYDDSVCEDGSTEFYTPFGAVRTPGLASHHSICGPQAYPELANESASKGREKCIAVSSNSGRRHVAINVNSHFFPRAKEKVKASSKKGIKAMPDTHISLPQECPAMTKTYFRKRRKTCCIKMNEVSTSGADKVKQPSGHLSKPLNLDNNGSQSAHLFEKAVLLSDTGPSPNKAAKKVRTSAYFKTTIKTLGQRDIMNKTWVPPVSVHALIQEELYQDPWKVLVACMLLNKTSGTQMRRVIWDLFALCPTPEAAVAVETEKIEEVIQPLGLQKKRARMIQKFSKDYLGKDWSNVGELHGIGKYATDAYAIFCEGRWQEVQPEDHKLVDYWQYLCATDGIGYAFKDDREKGDGVAAQMQKAHT